QGTNQEKFVSKPGYELHEKHTKHGDFEESKKDEIKKEGGKEYIEHSRTKTEEGRIVTDVSKATTDESGKVSYEHKVYTDPHIPGQQHHPARGFDESSGYSTSTENKEMTKQEMID